MPAISVRTRNARPPFSTPLCPLSPKGKAEERGCNLYWGIESYPLEALGALLYFVPYVFGVQFSAVAPGSLGGISNWLVSGTNNNWAVGLAYVTTALFAIMGAIAVGYTLITGGRAEVPEATTAQ